eukprot:gene723-2147_t
METSVGVEAGMDAEAGIERLQRSDPGDFHAPPRGRAAVHSGPLETRSKSPGYREGDCVFDGKGLLCIACMPSTSHPKVNRSQSHHTSTSSITAGLVVLTQLGFEACVESQPPTLHSIDPNPQDFPFTDADRGDTSLACIDTAREHMKTLALFSKLYRDIALGYNKFVDRFKPAFQAACDDVDPRNLTDEAEFQKHHRSAVDFNIAARELATTVRTSTQLHVIIPLNSLHSVTLPHGHPLAEPVRHHLRVPSMAELHVERTKVKVEEEEGKLKVLNRKLDQKKKADLNSDRPRLLKDREEVELRLLTIGYSASYRFVRGWYPIVPRRLASAETLDQGNLTVSTRRLVAENLRRKSPMFSGKLRSKSTRPKDLFIEIFMYGPFIDLMATCQTLLFKCAVYIERSHLEARRAIVSTFQKRNYLAGGIFWDASNICVSLWKEQLLKKMQQEVEDSLLITGGSSKADKKKKKKKGKAGAAKLVRHSFDSDAEGNETFLSPREVVQSSDSDADGKETFPSPREAVREAAEEEEVVVDGKRYIVIDGLRILMQEIDFKEAAEDDVEEGADDCHELVLTMEFEETGESDAEEGADDSNGKTLHVNLLLELVTSITFEEAGEG